MTDAQTVTGLEIQLPSDLHALVRLILDRADLQKALGGLAEVDGFVAAALKIAAANAIVLDEASLRAVLRPDPLGMGRYAAAPITLDRWPPSGWLPTRSVPTGGAPALDWLWFGTRKLSAPFFEDEVRRAGFLPLNWLMRIRTGLADLVAGAENEPSLPIDGLIFHMSRCGSTLAAQMLGAVPVHAVSSEPEPLDAVLRWAVDSGIESDRASEAIRAVAAALGRIRAPGLKCHFIKLDVWHTLYLPALRLAFPQTNWVYLHREPVEVLVSLEEQPSMHTVPGTLAAAELGLDADEDLTLLEYTAKTLGAYGQAVIDHWPLGGGLVLDYPDLRAAVPTILSRHFRIALTEQDRASMCAAGGRNAKAPNEVFVSDNARKHAAAGPELRAASARWLDPVRAQLQHLT